ncbi:MAG: geranylgeranylglycerol-phosphate geranylgeranyltransferase [Candidatus Bathyarchaeota archaeon]|nr:geranylgeranylglycerol-phosphate geranylgeranyltransferase [Candidatus Bathyarchaeota archaeon]
MSDTRLREMGKPSGFLRIIRPLNCLMMGFAVIVGASLVSALNFSINLLLGFVTSSTLTGASMAINDYYDREIDAINEPNRPIPSGTISPKEALSFAAVLSLVGFAAALMTNISCLIVAVITWMIFVTYTTKGKRTGLPGNLLVSTCVVIPFIYGGFVVENLELSVILFAAMAFLSNTGREIAKGIVDVEGDKFQNIRTIALLFGERTAAVLSSILSVLAVSLSPLPWLWGLVSDWFLPFVILTDIGLIVSSISLLRNYSRKNARRAKNLNLVWFTTGLVAFIAGTFG